MQDNDSKRFTFRIQEEEPEPVYPVADQPSETQEIPLRKTNQRIATLAVLLPILTGLIVFYGYNDLKQRISALQNTGQTDVEKLTSQVDTTISSISQQVEQLKEETGKMQERLIKGLDATSKQMATIVKKVEKESAEMKALTAGAADKKSVETAVSDLNKKMEATRKETQTAAGDIDLLDERLTRELAVFTQRIKVLNTELERMQQESAAQVKNQVSQNELKAALEKLQTQYREELKKLSQFVENKLLSMEKKTAPALIPPTKPPSLSTTQPPPARSPAPVLRTQPDIQKKPSSSKGGIVEQNIE